MASATYRARIADQGASEVDGNVALTLTIEDILKVPEITGPHVRVLEGTSGSITFPVEAKVDDVLFVQNNRLAVLGRLLDIGEDAGSGFVELATGRIKSASEVDQKGMVSLGVTDERWVERDTEVFRTAYSAQLHPPGLTEAFKDRPAAGTTTYVVKEVDGDYVRIQPADDEFGSFAVQIPLALVDVARTDLKDPQDREGGDNPDGNFESLRFEYASVDRTIVTFNVSRGVSLRSDGVDGPLGTLANEGWLYYAWVYIPSHGLSVSSEITGRFHFANGYVPTEDVPLLIGGANGIHPATLARDLLDGTYGGDPVGYPTAILDALEELNLLPVWARVPGPAERSEWLRRNFYSFGIPPLVGTDLQLRPTPLRMPQDLDPSSLVVLSAATGATSWHHSADQLVNVLVLKSKRLRPLGTADDRGRTWPIDEYDLVDDPPRRFEHDTVSTIGEHVHTIETDLVLTDPKSIARSLSVDFFDVFGDGASMGSVEVPRDVSVQVGEHVLLDQDSLKGFNPETGDRSGQRLVQLINPRVRTPVVTVFDYLDKGPDAQPLDAPAVSVAQDGTDADLINVTVSGLSAGETAVVEATVSGSPPTSYDHVRSGVGNETISFRVTAGSGDAYVRAYATAPHRTRSPYDTDSVALTARPILVRADVVKFADFAQVRWTVEDAAGMRLNFDTHPRGTDPTLGGNVDVDASAGFYDISDVPPGDVVTVQLTPYSGWTGSAVSGVAGNPTSVQSGFVKKSGYLLHDNLVNLVQNIEVTFDENGEAVVSASGSEGVADLFVTVGNGSAPSDPTASVNDGSISGQGGTVATGVKVTTGRDAIVKVVAADIGGNLGAVSQVTVARRLGPFHKDTTNRAVTGTTTETTLETITIPADTLGSDGAVRLDFFANLAGAAGTKTLRLKLEGTTIYTVAVASVSLLRVQMVLTNDGSPGAQDALISVVGSAQAPTVVGLSEDSTADMDLTITGQLADGADTITVAFSIAEFLGTN